MFGWIRKLTQRTAVEELIDSSPAIAPENSDNAAAQPRTPSRGTEAFARPVTQKPAEPEMVEVYTPEPMPEPPTSEIPEPQQFERDAVESRRQPDARQADARQAAPEDRGFVAAPATDNEHAVAPVDGDAAPAVETQAVETQAQETHAQETQDRETQPAVAPADAPTTDLTAEDASTEDGASAELERSPLAEEFDGLLAPPSPRPAMPLSAHPNFAGLGLAQWEPIAPRLLEPEAALTPDAQIELHKLFDDLFGPCGRYRLEWRTERRAGDDAMFAEIMTADLVRRVQNTIADVAELERPEPPKAIRAAFSDRDEDEQPDADDGEAFRRAS